MTAFLIALAATCLLVLAWACWVGWAASAGADDEDGRGEQL